MNIATPGLAALSLLLLAGCGGAAAPVVSDNPAHAACRAEAAQAPGIAEASRRVMLGLPASQDRFEQARREAERQAFNDCLRRSGLVRGGGVEPLRRSGF